MALESDQEGSDLPRSVDVRTLDNLRALLTARKRHIEEVVREIKLADADIEVTIFVPAEYASIVCHARFTNG